MEAGDYEIAETMLEEALAINQRVLPGDHPDIAITKSGIAVLLLATDRPEAALQMATAANGVLTQAYGEEHWRTAWAPPRQGAAPAGLSRFADAEPLLVNAYETLRSTAGAGPVHVRRTPESGPPLLSECGPAEDPATS